jgi:hypothetical protein
VTHRTSLTFDSAVEQTINLVFVAINEGYVSSLDLFILGAAHMQHIIFLNPSCNNLRTLTHQMFYLFRYGSLCNSSIVWKNIADIFQLKLWVSVTGFPDNGWSFRFKFPPLCANCIIQRRSVLNFNSNFATKSRLFPVNSKGSFISVREKLYY